MGTSEPIRELKGGYWREETDVSIVPNLVGLNSNQVRTKSSRTWIRNRVQSSSTLHNNFHLYEVPDVDVEFQLIVCSV